MARARVRGVELFYLDRGEGVPILWVHGYSLDHTMWEPQVEALSDCRHIAPDLRGHGETPLPEGEYEFVQFTGTVDYSTPPPAEGYSIRDLAEDLAALLGHLGISRGILAGLSMGGYVALRLILEHPERFAGLILLSTRSEADDAAGLEGREQNIRLIEEKGSAAFAVSFLPKLFGEEFLRADGPHVRAVRERIASQDPRALVAAQRAMRAREATEPRLGEIRVPVLIFVGERDILTPPAHAEVMRRGIAGSRLVVLPGVGHMSNLEAAERVNQEVGAFISGIAL